MVHCIFHWMPESVSCWISTKYLLICIPFYLEKKAKLAKKPKPWRISLLLEVIYGGWTLIRDMILSVFHKCKDIEFLTLLNRLDNHTPLVLSLIYSIVFKCNKYIWTFLPILAPLLGYVCCIPKTSLQQSITNHAFNIFALTRKRFNYVWYSTPKFCGIWWIYSWELSSYITKKNQGDWHSRWNFIQGKRNWYLQTWASFILIYICPSQKISFQQQKDK